MKYSHIVCLKGTPLSSTPLHTNHKIPSSTIIPSLPRLLPQSEQSSARHPRGILLPRFHKNHTQGLLPPFNLVGGLCVEPLPGKATCYLQVPSAPLEEPIKSILFLGFVWIHLLTSVSNISGLFILLSSWNTVYKVMKKMRTECTEENWVLL